MYSEAESALIALCLQGNRRAQQRLYQRYCDAMYNVCYRMLGTEAEAEDVLQDAFIDVFDKLGTFREESSLGAWIKRIVINHCLNVFKKRKLRFEELGEGAGEIIDLPGSDEEEVADRKSVV